MKNFDKEKISIDTAAYHVGIFKAFCDESRLSILELLRGGEKCACILLQHLAISQSTLSHHMKILCESGVVVGRREGKWMHYSLCQSGAQRAASLLLALAAASGAGPDNKNEKAAANEQP